MLLIWGNAAHSLRLQTEHLLRIIERSNSNPARASGDELERQNHAPGFAFEIAAIFENELIVKNITRD